MAPPSTLGGRDRGDQDVPLVEMDVTFARALGLHDGQKVTATVHLDPPLAHTINIEPLTPDDWEMVELHATFLEINLMNQIRAVPNPASGPATQHPLTLHLSPTSTAAVKVLSIEPALPADAPFAKVAPDAEVIVAPKTRPKPSRGARESRSVTSTSKKSGTSGRGGSRSAREEQKPALFLRAVDRTFCQEWFDEAPIEPVGSEYGDGEESNHKSNDSNSGLAVWVDSDLLLPNEFRGLKYAVVSLLRPGAPVGPRGGLDPAAIGAGPVGAAAAATLSTEPATRLVVHIRAWDDPPNGQTAALSSTLCSALGCPGIVGGIVKIEPASPPLATKVVQKVRIYPFDDGTTQHQAAALKFGGEAQLEKEAVIQRIKALYGGGKALGADGVVEGPLTDGLVLGARARKKMPPQQGGLAAL